MNAGLFKIKPPPAPPIPAIPAFDYVIDIYSDKVVITNPDGTTTQLSTITDLNNWLSNITGRKIRINVNVEIYDRLLLTPNEYWFFGEWIRGGIYLLGGKYTIISFTKLGDYGMGALLINYDPGARTQTDISGSFIYSVYSDAYIAGKSNMILSNVSIYIELTMESYFEYINGDLYIRGGLVEVFNSTLRTAVIDADVLRIGNVAGGAWMVRSWYRTDVLYGSIDLSSIWYGGIQLRNGWYIRADANTTKTLSIPTFTGDKAQCKLITIGVMKAGGNEYYDSLPSGVTYYFDETNNQLVIQNTTPNTYWIFIVYELKYHKPWSLGSS